VLSSARMSVTPSAPEILHRLEQPGALASNLLEAAEAFFADRGDALRARWLHWEREGFPETTRAADLPDLLGLSAPQGIVEAILRARLRRGRVIVGDPGRVVEWPRFFVEPVDRLRSWHERLAHGGSNEIMVDLDAAADRVPSSLAFPREVFTDVLQSIALEIADAIRRAET